MGAVGDEGLEPRHNSSINKPFGGGGDAGSGALSADPQFQQLLENWPHLSADVKRSIAAIVDAHLAASRALGRES